MPLLPLWTFVACSRLNVTYTFNTLNIILPTTLFLYPSGFPTKTLYKPLLSPIRATCPTHLTRLDLITRIIFGEEYKSLSPSSCSFLHSPVTSSLFDQMFSSAPYSQTSSGYVPRSMWKTKFHISIRRPYVLYYIWYLFFCTHQIISQKRFNSE